MNVMIKVLLVDDHAIVRKGIVTLLETEADVQVVGEASNGLDAVQRAERSKPDVILKVSPRYSRITRSSISVSTTFSVEDRQNMIFLL